MAYITESKKTVKISKAYAVEKSITVNGLKIYLVEDSKTVLLWDGGGVKGTFLVVGASGTLLKSADGVEWEKVTTRVGTTAVTDDFYEIAYGNGVLVALCDYGKIHYSTDGGNTWTTRNYSIVTEWSGLAFGNGKFVIMSGSPGYPYTYYSTDGHTWTRVSEPSLTSEVFGVKYVGNKFFAYTIDDSGREEDVWVSDDGITWTDITDAFTYGYATTWVAYAFGKYYINTGNYMYYSTNGTTWTRMSGNTSAWPYCATASEEIIAFAGAPSSSWGCAYYMTSDNVLSQGTGLSATTYGETSFVNMIYQDKFVVVGANSQIAYSKDGKVWTQITALDTSVDLRDICFIPDE